MLNRLCALTALLALTLVFGLPFSSGAEDPTAGLSEGSVDLKSAGPLGFGPKGILFVGDPQAATIYAIDTGDRSEMPSKDQPKVEGINEKIASLLGTEAKQIQVKDLAVNPISHNTYLSVARGTGPKSMAVLVKVTPAGKLSEVSLKNIKHSKTTIPNAVEGKNRQEAITHLAYLKGRLLVAGLSNEEFASKLRSIPYPFDKTDKAASIEIFHGAHGKFETRSPIRVFAPYKIGAEEHVLAAYTCTPLVKMPVSSLEPGKKVMATTVAELGNRNRPLSMIIYHKDGKDYVLMANSARGLMKIQLEGVDKIEGITKPIKGGGTAGLKYETIKDAKGVQKLDAYDKGHAVVLTQDGGKLNLNTIELP